MSAAAEYRPVDWIMEALRALRPPGKMRVHEWADQNRILTAETSARPGRWRTSVTPYLAEVMDAFDDPEVEEISFVKSTQVGGTEAILNMMGKIIDRDPSPTMVVYPTSELGEYVSRNRIQTMVNRCSCLREKYDPTSKLLELQFEGMSVVISGANSPASLSARPVRNLFMDEVDKFPVAAGKEADPRELARERTNSYRNNRKIVNASTPTYEDGAIWKDWTAADTQYEYFVSCPHCEAEWTFTFKNLKFDNSSPDQAAATAVYVCPRCGGIITDREKKDMVQSGRWKPLRERGRRRIAYRITAFYSPWLSFGDIAYKFVKSHKDPALLMNFINSWLAEPFKQVETTLTAEYLLEHRQGQYKAEMVPPGTVMITGGVDVQRECFYWTIRGWRANMTSYNLCHGKAFTWQEVEYAMNRTYRDKAGQPAIVNLCCVDSGDQTDDVYDFCLKNREWAVPVKGASQKMPGRFRRTIIDRTGSRANGMTLYILDTNYYKTMLAARMERDEDEGGFFLHLDCDPEYCEMLTAEHCVIRKYNGRMTSVWEPKVTGRDNHYWDAEIYAALAADLRGIREMAAETARQEQPAQEAAAPAVQETWQQATSESEEMARRWFRR